MNRSTVANRWNLELIEENYQRWSGDPTSVDATWQAFFEGYELAVNGEPRSDGGIEAGAAQAAVTRLIDAYREIGHYLADLDPLKLTPPGDPSGLLEPSTFGLTNADLDRTFHTKLFEASPRPPFATSSSRLETCCTARIGIEFSAHPQPFESARLAREEPDGKARNEPGALNIKSERRIILTIYAAEVFGNRSPRPLHRRHGGSRSKAASP